MGASLTWTDADGAATLDNGLVLCRFNTWEPRSPVVGQKRRLLANGARRVWEYRTDRIVSFTFPLLPRSKMTLMDRLAEHLDREGTVSVATGDTASSTYPTCQLAPDAEAPWPKLSDPKLLLYRMDFVLIDMSATPQRMIATY